ncbi:MAG: hypothetical protein LAT76_00335 [Schleiferiaceae bacterium]|nr:hypothetical protein [Schleiferiaceae bacterium]
MKGKYLLFAVSFFTVLACDDDTGLATPTPPVIPPSETPSWQTYHIDAGNHSANESNFQLFTKDTLAFKMTFDETAIYQTIDPQHQLSWSKVLGFSDCGTHHHSNSARLVWRWNENVGIELAGYVYIDGVRTWNIVDTIQVNDTVSATVYRTLNSYVITTQETKSVQFSRHCSDGISYWLYPYFGGQEPAPQDVRVHILLQE